jgi:pimeloyl-ACP methyl ester carboxylesterase
MSLRTLKLDDGREATYVVVGEGEPALWFEGGPGFNAAMGRADCELLADRFAFYLVDAHGTGGSTPPADPRDYRAGGTARFYESVRRALGLGRVTVLGHSWGGTVCLTYAALFPEATRRCVAVGAWSASSVAGSPAAAAEFERGLARFAGAPWIDEATRLWDESDDPGWIALPEPEARYAGVWPLYFAHPESPTAQEHIARLARDARFGRGPWAATTAVFEGNDELLALLPSVTAPVLLLYGELDFICGLAHARAIAELAPGARLVVLPDCGHMPACEQPALFRAAVLEWMDRAGA